MEIRRQDYSLSEDQESIRDMFAGFLAKECPSERVRKAEPLGYDADLWRQIAELGATSIRLPEEQGGIGASLVDLCLIAEECGRTVAPVPFVDVAATVALIAGSRDEAVEALLGQLIAGEAVIGLALAPVSEQPRQLISVGGIASAVVALDGDDLVLVRADVPPTYIENIGTAPLAWWNLGAGSRTVLASGDDARRRYLRARDEWRLMTAAALTGLSKTAIAGAVEYAKTRMTSGVPMGALQGVAHPLADAETLVAASRHLNWKAAWFHDNEPAARPELAAMAYSHADKMADIATGTAVHMQGGLGYTLESDATLYFRRAKGWSLLGSPNSATREVGDALAAAAQANR